MRFQTAFEFVLIGLFAALTGCATPSSIGKAASSKGVPEDQLSILATASASSDVSKSEQSMIHSVDGEFFWTSGWKALVPPGRHKIVLRNNSINKAFEIDVLPGKHYDILYSGYGYMRDRAPESDTLFVGGNKPGYERLTVQRIGVDDYEILPQSVVDRNAREVRIRREQYSKEHASEITAQNAKYEAMRKARAAEEARQAEADKKLAKQRGQKVCRSVDGTFSTFMPIRTIIGVRDIESQNDALYYLTAVTEANTESKIQIRISSIYRMDGSRVIYVDKLAGEPVYQTSALVWVNVKDWRPCR